MEVLRTHSLTKRFGPTLAVDGISIRVQPGEIYGFLGLNGAGKTTLIRMLLGLIRPDQGEVYLFEKKLSARFDAWNDVGYLVETPAAYPDLSVVENLQVYYQLRRLKDPKRIPALIDQLKLGTYAHTKAKNLSLGNQQRLGLAKALLHQPQLLLLDEPTNGLDPEGIVEVRQLLQALVAQGATVFLSSHILGEIAKVATRLGIIHEGRLVQELTNQELTQRLHRKLIVSTLDNPGALRQLSTLGYQVRLNEANELEITDPTALEQPEKIAQVLVEKGYSPRQLYRWEEDLERYFLRIIRNRPA
ncbi:ABC transporter ATP-binding protein [Rhabdobacter roseus]|uniref:ABC-2 type transport system ATP-binding protein n=1 Tax=Rhabdobacter roseus TaxID=1655419 RepID=A0A840TF73_9BACT|nr:ATP-binding cassette domain-containing protein [Rhabdobacter roseus]MBB5282766.1 ABC-2 type transport system ATP-binding protein [Rhabdobacter roseus]